MNHVRFGIVGIGNIGAYHVKYLQEGKVSRAGVTAICDGDAARMEKFENVEKFTSTGDMIRSGRIDAVIIATPHFFHTTVGIDALENGLHVLVEKPLSVHKADCERLIAAWKPETGQIFGAMFQQRTEPLYQKVKQLISDGELGAITRTHWIVTNWFRTQIYYDSGGWRATWAGEGGGVLMNQCPHNLDLFQWLCGKPSSVRAFCNFGKYHDIEVEDEVTAYLEYPGGATGVFITSTGEAPGTNRLEITGERGKLIVEDGAITFHRTAQPVSEFRSTSTEPFGTPAVTKERVPVPEGKAAHEIVTRNFVEAILDKTPLVAPGSEGIHSVEMANAMILSAIRGETVKLPMDSKEYEEQLQKLIASSKPRSKKVVEAKPVDMSASFGKA